MHEGGFAATQEQFEALFEEIIENYKSLNGGEGDVGRMMMSMLMDMPLRCMAMFGLAGLEEVEKRVEEWND